MDTGRLTLGVSHFYANTPNDGESCGREIDRKAMRHLFQDCGSNYVHRCNAQRFADSARERNPLQVVVCPHAANLTSRG